MCMFRIIFLAVILSNSAKIKPRQHNFVFRSVTSPFILGPSSSPGQPYSGTSFQVKSAWQSRSIPSKLRSRGSSTLDSFWFKTFLLSILSFSSFTSFCLSYFLFYSTSSSSLLQLRFPFSHPTGDNPHS